MQIEKKAEKVIFQDYSKAIWTLIYLFWVHTTASYDY